MCRKTHAFGVRVKFWSRGKTQKSVVFCFLLGLKKTTDVSEIALPKSYLVLLLLVFIYHHQALQQAHPQDKLFGGFY